MRSMIWSISIEGINKNNNNINNNTTETVSLFGFFFESSGCKFMFGRLLLTDFWRISVQILFNFFCFQMWIQFEL